MPVDEAACKFLEEATLLDLHTLYNPLPFSFNSINYKFSDLFFFFLFSSFFQLLQMTTFSGRFFVHALLAFGSLLWVIYVGLS